MRYQIRRERTMENKPDGEEHSASLRIWDTQKKVQPNELIFPVRFKGVQIWPEEDVRAYVQAITDNLNGESSGTPNG